MAIDELQSITGAATFKKNLLLHQKAFGGWASPETFRGVKTLPDPLTFTDNSEGKKEGKRDERKK